MICEVLRVKDLDGRICDALVAVYLVFHIHVNVELIHISYNFYVKSAGDLNKEI